MSSKTISFVLPTLNERENVDKIYQAIKKEFEGSSYSYEIIFVDDNSPDGTCERVSELRKSDPGLKYIRMSRRFGDQICLMAGIEYATGDAIITMDADLQHPPRYIPQMIKAWEQGSEIVIMKRTQEGHASFFKKWTEIYFYKIMDWFSSTPIYYRFAGFCLLDEKVGRAVRDFQENDPFLRGIIGAVGFQTLELEYEEDEREVGESKYHLRDMLKLATTGITSFSDVPLHLALYLGAATVGLSFLYGLYTLLSFLFLDNLPPGWASIIMVTLFIGGVQLLSVGCLGVYLGKIFIQTKERPNYIVKNQEGF